MSCHNVHTCIIISSCENLLVEVWKVQIPQKMARVHSDAGGFRLP